MFSGMALICNFSAYAVKVIDTYKGTASPAGTYEKVNESHNDQADYHTLSCENPGPKTCGWTTSPWNSIGIIETDIEQQVLEQVEGGAFTGSIETNGGLLTWDAQSLTTYRFIFEIEP